MSLCLSQYTDTYFAAFQDHQVRHNLLSKGGWTKITPLTFNNQVKDSKTLHRKYIHQKQHFHLVLFYLDAFLAGWVTLKCAQGIK